MRMAEPLEYELVKQFERRIAKFDVVGTDYRLRVQPLPDGTSYDEAVRLLYQVMDSKFHFSLDVSLSHDPFFYVTLVLFSRSAGRAPIRRS